jgi:hypothetical protein
MALRDGSRQHQESEMSILTMDAPNGGWNLGFVTRKIAALRMDLQERHRRRQLSRTMLAELRQYTAAEIVELGIARADISRIAADEGREHRREEEFRSALDSYIAGYQNISPATKSIAL